MSDPALRPTLEDIEKRADALVAQFVDNGMPERLVPMARSAIRNAMVDVRFDAAMHVTNRCWDAAHRIIAGKTGDRLT